MKPSKQAIQFFYNHAGYGYTPAIETAEQGRQRTAESLATAERAGNDSGLSFEWEVDQFRNSSDFSDESPAWELWACVCRYADGSVCSSLGGVDFGRDGSPWGNPYRRVVEAELATEAVFE